MCLKSENFFGSICCLYLCFFDLMRLVFRKEVLKMSWGNGDISGYREGECKRGVVLG